MHSQTYGDLIEEKISEWRRGLKKLGMLADKAGVEQKGELRGRVEELRAAIDAAVVQLRDLDKQETVANTMETKAKILDIFSSIDKGFSAYQEKTPFML